MAIEIGFARSRMSKIQVCLMPSAALSAMPSSATTSRSRSGSGSGLWVPPPYGGAQLRCTMSSGLARSATSSTVSPPSRQAPYAVSPATSAWCSPYRHRTGSHEGVSPAARFCPGIHHWPATWGFFGSFMSIVMNE
ncbi:MAG: hypothetical protein QOC67_1757 [Pseudonocardiales bacterium]|nr:hypothetical protein [Pseudonocardiales bacterium]